MSSSSSSLVTAGAVGAASDEITVPRTQKRSFRLPPKGRSMEPTRALSNAAIYTGGRFFLAARGQFLREVMGLCGVTRRKSHALRFVKRA